ncbi:acid protease [Xylona heveae TC161]|uniref:Acid protease n=1 Tax=Xylona heveae (strain CBS 132557 / TC161) TaxID=1328760 RepID=A0A165J405_XYLHT|nr:acid protease [Xylona heveae TC161]KZF25698.1 acid protease [Xylona heveae TC161]
MRFTHWILHVSYLSTCVLALHESTTKGQNPDTPVLKISRPLPSDDLHPFIRNVKEVNHLIKKYRSRGLPGPDFDEAETLASVKRTIERRGTPVKRAPSYTIATGAQPTETDSMALEQDGNDISYLAAFEIGSGSTPLNLLIDTGAGDTWVMGSNCTTKSCQAHHVFNQTDSKSFSNTGKDFSIRYGTGSVSGVVVQDTISFAGFSIKMAFGAADQASDDFLAYPQDGILGLGRKRDAAMGIPTVMEVLSSGDHITNSIFSVFIQREADSDSGEISFGTIDDSRFEGDLAYTSTVSDSTMWEIPVDHAGAGGKNGDLSNKSAIIDTGTSYILMPSDDAKEVLSQISGFSSNGDSFELPCTTNTPLQFTFSGSVFNVSSKDYLGGETGNGMCSVNVVGRQAFGPDQWILGDVFLKNVYAVFDLDKDQIGLARKSTANPTRKAPSTKSGGASPTTSSSHTAASNAATKTLQLASSATSTTQQSANQNSRSATHLLQVPWLLLSLSVLAPLGCLFG